jgi:hypothetical protein
MGSKASRPVDGDFYADDAGLADESIDGAGVTMSRFAGRVALVVNVATA